MSNPYATHDPYSSNSFSAHSSNGFSVYQKNSNPYSKMGNQDLKEQRLKDSQHAEQAGAIGIAGAMLGGNTTAAAGAVALKAGAAAGMTGLAGAATVPAVAMLAGVATGGIAAMVGLVVAKGVYRGIKSLANSKTPFSNTQKYQPQRTNNPNLLKEFLQKNQKADKYVKNMKKDFKNGRDISSTAKDLMNLKGLSSKNSTKINDLYSDNIIRKSTINNNDKVSKVNMTKQVLADAKEQNWSKAKTKKVLAGVNKRVETHKKNQNINQKGKALDVVNSAKTKISRATKMSGKSIKPANSPKFQKQQQAQQASRVHQDAGRGR